MERLTVSAVETPAVTEQPRAAEDIYYRFPRRPPFTAHHTYFLLTSIRPHGLGGRSGAVWAAGHGAETDAGARGLRWAPWEADGRGHWTGVPVVMHNIQPRALASGGGDGSSAEHSLASRRGHLLQGTSGDPAPKASPQTPAHVLPGVMWTEVSTCERHRPRLPRTIFENSRFKRVSSAPWHISASSAPWLLHLLVRTLPHSHPTVSPACRIPQCPPKTGLSRKPKHLVQNACRVLGAWAWPWTAALAEPWPTS